MIQTMMKQLHTELKLHFRPFLNPPAAEEDIQKAENEMEVTFPEELRALYLTHNGEKESGPGLFFGLPFLSLQEMITEWRIWKELEGDEELGEIDAYSVPPCWIKEKYVNRRWIPISRDYGGNHIGIDLDPDQEGQAGQVINFGRDEEIKYVIAHHVTDLLIHITNTLKHGHYTIDEYDDAVSWSYGKEEELHFLDAIRSMELPVLHARPQEANLEHTDRWLRQLDDRWTTIVETMAESPKAFCNKIKLRLAGRELTYIKPLSICTDMRELNISANRIHDLTPLQSMIFLKKLYLGNNPVADLKPIAQLKHLQYLNVEKTCVTDLSPLADLSSLRELDMTDIQAAEYAPLSHCKNLEFLKVDVCNEKQINDISQISTLKRLHIRGDEHVSEEEIKAIAGLKTLRSLTVENITLENVDFLGTIHTLQTLKLINSSVKDGTVLAGLEHLKRLELDGSEIVNLKVVAQSPSLEEFTGSFDQFYVLKDICKKKVDFSKVIGDMSEEEEEIWSSYVSE
ncbi:SMI1/KNR4 family protein [Bacillus paralicheniformis]|uniref:SMI1/KNR4 family protein n=1 Tax=Bacillus paralicheniformis TaxID=1648923 RepID=UPI000D847A0E|nr:SMI1/KNR4 family protein [Bacillus paralicheniformis]MED1218197.1 SMI1/KNR4 family protein [Bacillus paralicheniformis]QSF97024.1 SMI1/KNR4 family protein [Bacillus paralicheniformis]